MEQRAEAGTVVATVVPVVRSFWRDLVAVSAVEGSLRPRVTSLRTAPVAGGRPSRSRRRMSTLKKPIKGVPGGGERTKGCRPACPVNQKAAANLKVWLAVGC
jgi:hypothetical protein